MNTYRVTCSTLKNGFKRWGADIEANTAEEARRKFLKSWNKKERPLDLMVRKLK